MGSSPSPPPPDPDDDPSAAMMAAMGFSSFGGPDRPSKKRRFNPHADAATTAITLGPAPSSLPPKPPVPARRSATGANQLPLHPRGGTAGGAAVGGGGAQNDDEIDLEDEPGPEVSGPAPGTDEDDPESRYIDTSRPPAPLEGEAGDDGFGGEPGHPVGPPGITRWQPSHGAPPPPGRGGGYGGGRGRGRGRGGGSFGNVPGQAWSVGYYDPSSNENPWLRLETARGLEPVGSWLAPGHGRSG